MTEQSSYDAFVALASSSGDDEEQLVEVALRVGADLEGLQRLVMLATESGDRKIALAVGFPLARATWEFSSPENLLESVFEFGALAVHLGDLGPLSGGLTAFQGLVARGALEVCGPEQQESFARFLAACLDHGDVNSRASALDFVLRLIDQKSTQRFLGIQGEQAIRLSVTEALQRTDLALVADADELREWAESG